MGDVEELEMQPDASGGMSDAAVEDEAPDGEYDVPVEPVKSNTMKYVALTVMGITAIGIIAYFTIQTTTEGTIDARSVPTVSPTSRPTCLSSGAAQDIIFIIDESGSVGQDNFDQTMDSLADLATGFDFATTRFGLVAFSGTNQTQQPYPSTNLEEHAINHVVNLWEASDADSFRDIVTALPYTPFDPTYCDPLGNKREGAGETCLPARIHTCISCAFQYLLSDYLTADNGEGETNSDSGRLRYYIFIGDGKSTRGFPINPSQPVTNLRNVYDGWIGFIPVQGNEDIVVDWLGDAIRNEPSGEYPADVQFELNSYADLLPALISFNIGCDEV